MIKLIRGLLGLYLFFFFAVLSAQSITISGRVTAADTEQGLAFATVRIFEAATVAEADGRFTLVVPPADRYLVEISYLGYGTLTTEFSAREVREPLVLALEPEPIVFAEILVQDRRLEAVPQQQVLTDPSAWVSQPRDAGELFRSVPGFALIKRGGFALEPVYRGFQKDQLNIIVNGGMQMTNACPARMDPATTHLSPESIERLEIISGPYSVRYGLSDGPIINLVTARPALGKGWGGQAGLGYESNGGSYFTSMHLRTGGEKYGLNVSGSLRDFGDYTAGNGQEIPSSFRSYHYATNFLWQPAANHQLQLSWQQAFERDVDHAGLMMDTESDDSYGWSVDYYWRARRQRFQGLKVKAYGFSVDHLMSNTLRPNFMMTEATTPAQAQTYGGRMEGQWNLGGRWIAYLGADLRTLARQGLRTRVVKRNMTTGEPLPQPMVFEDQVWQDAALRDLGWFAEARFLPSTSWSVTAGLRVDQGFWRLHEPDEAFLAMYEGKSRRTFQPLLTGHVTTTYRGPEHWVWQLALARGGRLPAMDELGIFHFGLGRDPYEYVGNPNLKPEENYQSELSLQRDHEALTLRLSAFAGRWNNFITANVDSLLPRKYMPMSEPRFARRFTNVSAWQTGGAASLEWALGYWQLGAQAAYTYTQNLDWDEPLPQIAPLQGSLSVGYERPIWWARLQARGASRQGRPATSFQEAETPAFAVFDLRAGVHLWEKWELGAAVLNLADATYYEHLTWAFRNLPQTGRIYEPGRNISLLLRYSW